MTASGISAKRDRRRRVLHLIPYPGIGGVEEAARSMADVSDEEIEFRVRYLFPDVASRAQRAATFNPLRILAAARAIASEAPDLLVVSLWRAAIAGIVVRLLNPQIRLVLFIHNSADAHIVDAFATRLALRMCDEVWTDSEASIAGRFGRQLNRPVTTISYLVHRLGPPSPRNDGAAWSPVFAFWGRLSPQKDVGRALRLFARILEVAPDARFRIIGPDGGEEKLLRALASELGIERSVEFLGPMPFGEIPGAVSGASFYLQTSRYEGMALSVTEAMQLGLIPVVTPVGEIARYCRDGVNAILVGDRVDDLLAGIGRVLKDRELRRRMSAAAIATWSNKELYAASVLKAARACLSSGRDPPPGQPA